MATIVQLKRSSVSGKQPDAANIQVGEPVVNLADQVVYTKTGSNAIVVIGAGTTSNISEGVNLYYTNARARSAFTAGSGITITDGVIAASAGGGGGGSSVTVSETEPVGSSEGDIWFQGSTGIFFIYYGNRFREYSRALTEYFNEDYEEESYDQLKLQYGITQLADFTGTPSNGDFITFNGTSFGPSKSFTSPFSIIPLSHEPNRITGTLAVADNSSWDPVNYGGSNPYPVFYDGNNWINLINIGDQPASPLNAGTGVKITSGTISIDQNVAATSSVEFRNLVLSGNLTVTGTSTIAKSSREIDIHDPLIYLNEPISANVVSAVGDGSNVTYSLSSNHIFQVGEVARITGINPSELNQNFYTTIVAVTSNTVTISKVDTNSYVSGGVLYSKVAIHPDIGFSGGYTDGSYSHAGLFRDATDGKWKFFDKYDPEPDASIFIDTTDPSFKLANVEANSFTANTVVSELFVGNVIGDVVGDVVGNVSGNFSGTLNGTLNGSVSGDINALSFYTNPSNITSNLTITASVNAMKIGPITIDDGVLLTIEQNGSLVII